MSEGEGEAEAIKCTPTDPSLEFDIFEMVRLRLAEVLERRGHDQIEAERVALYVVQGTRPLSRFLKVLTRISPPEDEEIVAALSSVLDEAPALEKARHLLLRAESGEQQEQ